ncbi:MULTISPECIES: hypothetical protein [Bradyrhizobium]|nr:MULTISPECIES: hypothetical protein [Bradyrhizobium]
MIVRDGNQLRSANAAFDPAKRNSLNLMYGVRGAVSLAGEFAAAIAMA